MPQVEVLYAAPRRQRLYVVELSDDATIRAAIEASGVLRDFPQIELARQRIGIFGRLAPLDTVVRDGDRVEIYRALQVDPKDGRRKRARRAGA